MCIRDSNGSGKSTALKILAGIYRQTSGSIVVNGRLRALLELGAGFHPDLTGRENIYLNGSILGMTQREINLSMDEIIEFAGIGDFIDSPVKIYSSGMAVRLGFAVAVKMDPEILIVDEVIGVGDEDFQRRCNDYMRDLRRRGTTIVLVTHSMGLVDDLCDEAIWLDHGTVHASGRSSTVVRDYLAGVNQAEATRLQSSGLNPIRLSNARRGSGEIRVRDVQALDAAGQPLPVMTTDEPCRFRIRYVAQEPVESFHVSIGFYTDMSTCISFAETRRDGRPQSTPVGEGHIDFTMDALPLRPGTYLISVVLSVDGHFYDILDQEVAITVRSPDVHGLGLVTFGGRWGQATSDTGEAALADRTATAGNQPTWGQ